MSFEEISFKTEPNFKYKGIVKEKSECLSSTYQYDCYKDKNGEIFLISAYWDIERPEIADYHISLISLKDNIEVRKLKGHEDRILNVRYFQDPYTKNDFLISSDRKCNIIIWDLQNFSQKFKINIRYDTYIYSVLLFFDSNKIYAVSSTLSDNGYTKVIEVGNNNNIVNIKDSKNLPIYFLLYWFNSKKERHNIIQCGKNKILINEFPNNEIYHSFNSDEKHPYNMGGIVFKNKGRDLLAVSATYGLIQIYDLEYKEVFIKLELEKTFLYSFVKWNDNYLLINDCLNKSILLLDMKDSFQVKKRIECPEMYFDRFIKKVDHPLYGESILSIGIDWKIKLFTNENK